MVVLMLPHWKRASLVAAMLFLLTATTCSQAPEPPTRKASESPIQKATQTGRHVAIPRANYAGVAWLRPDTIFISLLPDSESLRTELWSVRLNGSDFVQVPIADPECAREDIHALTRLPDRRIGFIEFCMKNPNFAIPNTDGIFLSAVDPASGRVERLMNEPLGFNGHQFTWNPQLTEGFASTLSDLCGSVAGLNREGLIYRSIPVEDAGSTWDLADFFLDSGEHCDDYGRADWPAWSPDGASVAFFASAPQMEGSAFDRVNLPWSIFVMSARDLEPRKVLGGILHPRGLSWSIDGRLAFSGTVASHGSGTWTFDPDSGELAQVSSALISWLDWSPEGTKIAAISNVGPPAQPEDTLLIFDATPAT